MHCVNVSVLQYAKYLCIIEYCHHKYADLAGLQRRPQVETSFQNPAVQPIASVVRVDPSWGFATLHLKHDGAGRNRIPAKFGASNYELWLQPSASSLQIKNSSQVPE